MIFSFSNSLILGLLVIEIIVVFNLYEVWLPKFLIMFSQKWILFWNYFWSLWMNVVIFSCLGFVVGNLLTKFWCLSEFNFRLNLLLLFWRHIFVFLLHNFLHFLNLGKAFLFEFLYITFFWFLGFLWFFCFFGSHISYLFMHFCVSYGNSFFLLYFFVIMFSDKILEGFLNYIFLKNLSSWRSLPWFL